MKPNVIKVSHHLIIVILVSILSQCNLVNAQIDYGTPQLINSLTDQPILNIMPGDTYNLNVVGDSLNIVAIPPSGATEESVRFLTSINEDNIESVAPYAYKEDVSGNFYSWITLPNYLDVPITFTIQYWSQNGAGGTLLGDDIFTITFTKPTPDNSSPSAPTSLTGTASSTTTIALSWNAATDNVGVTGYNIYQDNVEIAANWAGTTYDVNGLSPATSYDFKVRAMDSAGNESANSNTLTVTTNASSGGGGNSSSVWTESNTTASYNGQVGIGVTTVQTEYKLAVNGKIRSKEVRVEQNNWPDYVFSKEYDLPTLKEIQEHINEKGHLPNIPSAQEVEENGIELGEMNKLLLKKIEELTLYILQQEKRIQKLENQSN
ncbi:hypothetical protein MTsPCn5_35720 [Croceitalea sp. MTPC5]|uniref:fibronectin type III domain-containing protein n=1 Tax=Croceitalea sp. MTPC5 TaxID=3056565 RepID=UPI002B3E7F3E|nr:hypothetical protein MTsPCn5_35720 [Croceitalea sp. MTPC5]